MHYGVFAANPRWQITVPPGQVCHRIVTLPRFFLDAQGPFVAECGVTCQVGEQAERLTLRGPVQLALLTAEDYYSGAGAAVRQRIRSYEQYGFVYPRPEAAEPVHGL